MTSQTEKKIITIRILPTISRSKGNKTTKLSQLIECKMRNFFLGKWYIKCNGETSPGPFTKILKLRKSLDQQSELLCSLFLLCAQVEDYQNILKLRCWPLASSSYKAALENNKRSGTSLHASFSAWFLKKHISDATYYYVTNFIVWLIFLLEILGNMCIIIICFSVCVVINFEINLFNQSIFLANQKSQDKNLNT